MASTRHSLKSDRVLRSQGLNNIVEYLPKKRILTVAKPKASSQQSSSRVQQPKGLSTKRKKKITRFLKKVHTDPPKIVGRFGSKQWINCLIQYLREPKMTSPSVDDVKRWMVDTTFFEETIKKILAGLPHLPSPPLSSISNDTLSTTSSMSFNDSEFSYLLDENSSSSGSNDVDEEIKDSNDHMQSNEHSELVFERNWNDIGENHVDFGDEKEMPNKKFFKCEMETKKIMGNCDDEGVDKVVSHSMKYNDGKGVNEQGKEFSGTSFKPSISFREKTEDNTATVKIFPIGFEWKTSGGQIVKRQELVAPTSSSNLITGHQTPSTSTADNKTGGSIPTFINAEDFLNVLVNNGHLFLRHDGDNCCDEPLDQLDILACSTTDIDLLQIYANRILEISARNTNSGNSHVDWQGAYCCASALNFVLQKMAKKP